MTAIGDPAPAGRLDVAAKMARDPYLAPVARRWGGPAVFEAGFFVDADPEDAPLDDVDRLCTPLAHVRAGLAGAVAGEDRRPVVLLSTGGFFPLHAGHRALMDVAQRAAADAGWWVVGGYLSPGHDDYLALKWGRAAPPAAARLASAAEALDGVDWLAVDPWEAQQRRVSVNYTDVTARLQAYLRHHIRPDIDVAYVCGADNARFGLAFALDGRCIVVDRPGSEGEAGRWRADARVAGAGARVLWAPGTHPAASSALRPGPWSTPTHRLGLRTENPSAVRTLGLAPAAWAQFVSAAIEELGRHGAVEAIPVDEQGPALVDGVISLDPLIPGEVDLAISRCFDLGGTRPLGHVARPGHPPLEQQVAAIRPGRWVLRDDDRWSGGTIEFVRSLLPPAVEVTDVVTALDDPPARSRGHIADCRDLLLGSDDGGLVLALPDGSLGRAPYLLPFVDPAARGMVPADTERAFSEAIWRLNAATFADTSLTVADLPAPTRRTLLTAGHSPSDVLTALCLAQAEALAALCPQNQG